MAHILIVEARFYDHLNDMLLAGARRAIEAAGHSHATVTVPGALDEDAHAVVGGEADGLDDVLRGGGGARACGTPLSFSQLLNVVDQYPTI